MMLLMIYNCEDDDDDYEDDHGSGYVYDDENVDYRNRDDDDGLYIRSANRDRRDADCCLAQQMDPLIKNKRWQNHPEQG